MAQAVERLPRKHEVLLSYTTKKNQTNADVSENQQRHVCKSISAGQQSSVERAHQFAL
jgi:hypothetical protein